MITKGTVEIEPVVATIHEEMCSGCRICNTLCPFNAIEFLSDKGVSYVNEALCKGCGTCLPHVRRKRSLERTTTTNKSSPKSKGCCTMRSAETVQKPRWKRPNL
jgi:MinD superfamily P-loop ATPase